MSCLDAALEYAARDRPVFPVGPDKRPLTPHAFKDATCDEEVIRAWWERWPNAGVGMPPLPGEFVLDVDHPAALAALESEHGFMPDTLRATTPRGGIHFWLQGEARTGTDTPVKGIDVRAGGTSYVVVPPTPGYEWRGPSEIAKAPPWLLTLLESNAPIKGKNPPEAWQQMLDGGLEDGSRNHSLARLVGHLLRRYVDPGIAAELIHAYNQVRCRPPKPTEEVDRILDSIASKEMLRREGSAR